MIKKIFSSQSKTITGAAMILGVASFASRFIGVIRDRLFAHYFGAGDILDAYYAAFRIPDFVYNLLIAGALTAGFIPVFLDVWRSDRDYAWRITNGILNTVALTMAVTAAGLWLFAPTIIKYTVPGFTAEKLADTVLLTRIMLFSPFILGVSAVVSGVLHSFKNFLVFSFSPILYNLGIILGVIFLTPILGIGGLAWGVVLGAILHLLIQLPALFQYGFRYRNIFLWSDPLVRKIGKLIIPRTLGLATQQINILVTTTIASTLVAGSIAIFNFANNLQYFAVGIIGHSFSLAAFPTFSRYIAENKKEEMIDSFALATRQILFLIIPVSVLFLFLRAQIIRVALGTGKFDWTATALTADTLAYFTISLFAQCLILLIARAYYAVHDTWTPFIFSLLAVVINIALAMTLKNSLGVKGLALAYSIAMIMEIVLLWLFLKRKLGNLREGKILVSLAKISLATIIMAAATQYLKNPLADLVDMTKFWGILTQGAISGATGLLIYGLMCYLLKVEEMLIFIQSFKRRWLKLFSVRESLDNV